MNLQVERLAELAIQLNLTGIETQAISLAQQAAREEWDYLQFLEQTLQSEMQLRQQRKQAMFTRMAGFPSIKTLDDFDFMFA